MVDSPDGTISDLGEFGLIQRLTSGAGAAKAVILGPGDDTAIVAAPDGKVVITTDLMVEGRHFRRDWSTPIDVGRKAAAASLADVAAMGAVPTALVVGLAAPGDLPVTWAVACTAGLTQEAALVGAVFVGGDVVSAEMITLAVTAIGDLQGREPVLRSGAKVGDQVAIAGRLGWAAAGLAVLTRGFRSPKVLVDAHRVPEPPYSAGPAAAKGKATSMIDVSDGLVADARHLAIASDVVIEIDTSTWAIAEPLQAAASAYNVDPREWMLTGGDDHALLATFPAKAKLPKPFYAIGVVTAPGTGGAGVSVDGVWRAEPGGHEHYR